MKILIVEDEPALAESICQYLANERFQCESAADFHTAQAKLESFDYDCIILDIGLPGGNGLDLLSALKKDGKEDGVLIISAKNSLDDRVQGLRLGADDYLTKPFHLSELSARVDAIIRRKAFDGSTIVQIDDIKVDIRQRSVQVGTGFLDLTPKEYELLLYLIRNRTRVISKAALVDHLWGEAANSADGYDFIYTHIKNLRKKLTHAGAPDYIQSIYGIGYKFRTP